MRAIIISDNDARTLLDQLQLSEFKQAGNRLPMDLTPEEYRKAAIEEIHSQFRFVVCRWLRDQGAEVIR
jgi:hypothetical protein